MNKRYMDFAPKKKRAAMSAERAALLEVAPEKAATVDFEATVASVASANEVIEEKQVTVKVGARKVPVGGAETGASSGAVSGVRTTGAAAGAPRRVAQNPTGAAPRRRVSDIARKPASRVAQTPPESAETAQDELSVRAGVKPRSVAKGTAGPAQRARRVAAGVAGAAMGAGTAVGVAGATGATRTATGANRVATGPARTAGSAARAAGPRRVRVNPQLEQPANRVEPENPMEQIQMEPMDDLDAEINALENLGAAEGAIASGDRKAQRRRRIVSRAQKRHLERRERTPGQRTGAESNDFSMQLMEEVPLDANLLNDPMERPISEFADLEELAQEIEEVTRGGAVIDEDMTMIGAGFSLQQEEPRFGVIEDYQPRFIEAEVEKRPLSGAANVVDADTEVVSGAPGMAGAARMAGVAGAAAGMAAGAAGIAARAKVATEVAGAKAGAMTAEEALKRAKQAKVRARAFERPGATQTKIRAPRAANQTEIAEARTVKNAKTGATGTNAINAAAANRAKMKIPQAHFINQNKVAKRPLSKTVYATQQAAEAASKGAEAPVQVVKPKKKGGALGMIIAIIITVALGAAAGTVAFLLLPR